MTFKKASKLQSFLRMAIFGVSGSGKTYSSLKIATALAKKENMKIAFIDTERGSAEKYADQFDFDVMKLDTFAPSTYVEAINEAQEAGYGILIVDSLSHAWNGKEGALEQVDKVAKRTQSGNTFGAWRDVTPQHNQLIDAILGYRGHVFATMRAKTEHAMEQDEKGKMRIRKLGLAPIQREGMEYEFDIVATMDDNNNLFITKTRCPELNGMVINKPGEEIADSLYNWLRNGLPAVVQILGVNMPKSLAENNPTMNGMIGTGSDLSKVSSQKLDAMSGFFEVRAKDSSEEERIIFEDILSVIREEIMNRKSAA